MALITLGEEFVSFLIRNGDRKRRLCWREGYLAVDMIIRYLQLRVNKIYEKCQGMMSQCQFILNLKIRRWRKERERNFQTCSNSVKNHTHTHTRPSVYTSSCGVHFFCWYSQIESKAVPNLAFLWQEIPCGCVSIFAYVCVWQTVSEIVPITLSSTLNCFALPLKWSLTFGGAAVRAKAFHCLWPYDLPATFMKKYSWMNRITFNKGKTQKHKMTGFKSWSVWFLWHNWHQTKLQNTL